MLTIAFMPSLFRSFGGVVVADEIPETRRPLTGETSALGGLAGKRTLRSRAEGEEAPEGAHSDEKSVHRSDTKIDVLDACVLNACGTNSVSMPNSLHVAIDISATPIVHALPLPFNHQSW